VRIGLSLAWASGLWALLVVGQVFNLPLEASGKLKPCPTAGNELFEELRTTGIAVGPMSKAVLPAPSMADGLDAKQQQEVLAAVAGTDYSLDELVRPSVVAPFILKYRDVRPSDPEAPAHGIDLWFVAHGDLDTLAGKDFLEKWQAGRKDQQVHVLTAAELSRRKLEDHSGEGRQERYGHAVFPVLDRVQVSATLHSVLTRQADSILAAGKVDPRFQGDAEFPNRWRPIGRDDEGRPKLGEPHPYGGAGAYFKITRLAEPAGALFVEYHLVFTEPKGWFGGANLLRSKVPILVQAEVRAFRRQLARAKK
jgi:hypothetical protein